ncbi:MAG TPA: aminotransferase IV [Clostridiaceae bacterium]|nr:aminotransferase IV [Clostridiaceae bacterium]
MIDNIGEYSSINGNIVKSENMDQKANDKEANDKEKVVYEVIRIIDGVPLFFEDHYLRMKNSIELLGNKLHISEQELGNRIKNVIDANGKQNCNVKVTVYHDTNGQNVILYISKSYYPTNEEFENGVRVGLLKWDRKNPNIKVQNLTYNEAVKKKLEEENIFETLLVNANGKITEGSKSNVFFVKKSKIYTAPDEYILKGVTRKYIIDVCRRQDIEIIETLISVDSLYEMEGLFLSGTSIKVLPVASINGHRFNSSNHPVILAARKGFDSLIEEYIKEYKSRTT